MTDVANAVVQRPRSRTLVWLPRIFLALVFVYVGAIKLRDAGMWVRLFEQIGIGQWFRYVTAIVEIVGGVLMLVPRATRVAVLLTSSAMVGALIVHATVTGFGPQTVSASVLLTLSLLVGWSHLQWSGPRR
jgi:putative oxidoreductase